MPDKNLYQLAKRLYDVAPWETWEETDVLKIIHPDSGETGYISIMGMLGQHRAMALYLGDEAYSRFQAMQEDDPDDPLYAEEDSFSLMMECRQLQISFGTRNELNPAELKAIKANGLTFRGDNWPIFRSYEAGYAPGQLNEREAEWMRIALEQFLAFYLSSEGEMPTLFREGEESVEMLTLLDDLGQWRADWTPCIDLPFEWPTPTPSELLVEKVRQIPQLCDVECHYMILPAQVGQREKPKFAYLALTAEPNSGMIIGMELLSMEHQTHEELTASVPDVFLKQWIKAGIRPASIRVKTITTYSMVEISAEILNIPLEREDTLPALDRALATLPF